MQLTRSNYALRAALMSQSTKCLNKVSPTTVSLGTVLRAEGRQLKLGRLLRMVFDSPCIKSHDKKGCLLVEHILPSIEASIRLFQRGAGRLNFDAVASLHHLVVSIARRKPHARMIA